ncbi:MAG: hypothetical protein KIT00_02910 [Rhodospirillales bacterium]|nr:hypothetical protein [Rhodospirillales bacterium]
MLGILGHRLTEVRKAPNNIPRRTGPLLADKTLPLEEVKMILEKEIRYVYPDSVMTRKKEKVC